MSFEDQSRLYNIIVSLVQAEYPLDDDLQRKASSFLWNLPPDYIHSDTAHKYLTKLVPDGNETFIKPQDMPIPTDSNLYCELFKMLDNSLRIVRLDEIKDLPHTDAVGPLNYRELIFRKVVLPSTQYLLTLCRNRHLLSSDIMMFFMPIMGTLLRIGPFHRPTMEFILSHRLLLAFPSLLAFCEENDMNSFNVGRIYSSLQEWKDQGAEVTKSGKRMMQALFSEGLKDTLDQILMITEYGVYGTILIEYALSIPQLLGSNTGSFRAKKH
ncbi:hypothetical protein BLNAU_6095 [Blattamonas nauphoetae]|uniref:Uncharacterized protein n=1 Tax=Blattamonas nauphoetae TaxID=2049346 RepID=A0ABQ9Y541_9EUKA|nr:hypothetical protein BLNAU_6095 [Blattamonas nauphoetae]